MGQIEDQWIYLRDLINDESDATAEARTSSFEGKALFLTSGETGGTTIPGANDETRALASACLASRANPVRARSVRRACHRYL